MHLQLNGRWEETPDFRTVGELAAWMELPAFGSAIELNGAVIPRARQPETPLREQDRLEVVRLVGGG